MPSPSISKESIFSTSTTPESPPRCNSTKACYYPPWTPGRRLYLTARSTSVILALAQLISVSVAAGAFSHKRWLDPCLSPAITTLCYSGIDVGCMLRWHTRSHHMCRAIYDGVIAVGFAVAAGFLGRLALPDIKRDGVATGVLGGVILYCMLTQVIIHSAVSVEGVRDTIKIRREARVTAREDGASA